MTLISMLKPRPISHGGPAVPGAAPRTQLQTSGWSFFEQLKSLEAEPNSRVSVNRSSGQPSVLAGGAAPTSGEAVLPLRFEALNKALEKISDREEWLMDHPPVFKKERNNNARIDFISRGGFVFNQQGDYVSHSVNPW